MDLNNKSFEFIHRGETNVTVEAMITEYQDLHPEGMNFCILAQREDNILEKIAQVRNIITRKENVNLVAVSVINVCLTNYMTKTVPCVLLWSAARHDQLFAVETGNENATRIAGVLNLEHFISLF